MQDYLERIESGLQANLLVEIEHKARFGEIKAHGVALTQKGDELYHKLLMKGTFATNYPKTHIELFKLDLAHYNFEVKDKKIADIDVNNLTKENIISLIKAGKISLISQTYEDFLATSAAGIENFNTEINSQYFDNKKILEKAMGRKIISRHKLHKSI